MKFHAFCGSVRCHCARLLLRKAASNQHITSKRTVSYVQTKTVNEIECIVCKQNTHICCRSPQQVQICSGKRYLSCTRSRNTALTVLGIETSCDDTGAAVVDQEGNILGEGLHTQTKVHVQEGGIIPPVARDLHRDHIDSVVTTALTQAGMSVHDVDAIATTVKPGLIMSLDIGMKFSRNLIKETHKPFIPIHHMEAHALTARMIESVAFPFLVLLMSGGHCILAIAKDVDDFLLLGKSLDIAPGDSIDKVARFLKLKDLPQCEGLSGGQAIELMSRGGDSKAFDVHPKMNRHYNCDFSFAGSRTTFESIITKEQKEYGVDNVLLLPNIPDICASFQYFLLRMISNRVRRAIQYCDNQDLLSDAHRTLVVSGGVGSNLFLRDGLQRVCEAHSVSLVCPPPKLCTDNGVMIAWNGMEKLKLNRGFADIDAVDIQAKCPLGTDISEDVAKSCIRVGRMNLLK